MRMKIVSKFQYLFLTLAIFAIVGVTGCSSSKKVTDENPAVAGGDENSSGDSDAGNAMGLQTIHFPYDSFILDGEARGALKSNASILKDYPKVKIQIEGHCDQRGGIQYNIALGEKRANAVKGYLEDLGISRSRISVISFGKEKPIDPATTEEAYAKNRRATFVITSR